MRSVFFVAVVEVKDLVSYRRGGAAIVEPFLFFCVDGGEQLVAFKMFSRLPGTKQIDS